MVLLCATALVAVTNPNWSTLSGHNDVAMAEADTVVHSEVDNQSQQVQTCCLHFQTMIDLNQIQLGKLLSNALVPGGCGSWLSACTSMLDAAKISGDELCSIPFADETGYCIAAPPAGPGYCIAAAAVKAKAAAASTAGAHTHRGFAPPPTACISQ